MAAPRVLLAACAEFPDLHDDGPPLLAALAAEGVDARPAVWDDPTVDWSAADLVVIRTTWDYTLRRDEFLAWAAQLPRVANPLPVLRWSTDKAYLADLAAEGVPVVPTTFVAPGEALPHLPPGECVLKPAVSAGARDTARFAADERPAVEALLQAIHGSGRTALLQPYVSGVDAAGEASVLLAAGEVTHAMTKRALLAPGSPPVGSPGEVVPREASAAELALARRAVEVSARVSAGLEPADLLYARVDMLPTDDGPVVVEVELVEPSLFLAAAADPVAAARAYAVATRRACAA